MNLAARYRLADGVAIRAERFGGLIYRHDNRRLYFLRSQQAADFLIGLNGTRSLEQAIEDFRVSRGVATTLESELVGAVAQLARIGIVTLVPADDAGDSPELGERDRS